MKARNVIIGAGISGLALGWHLKQRFGDSQEVLILESSHRPGGWIRSVREAGFLFEEGPRSCRSKGAGAATLQLIEELGLCDEVICASSDAKKRYLYLNGKLHAVPGDFFSFLTSPIMKGVIPALWKEWRVPPSHLDDESIADFIERRLNREIAEKFMDPLVSGIYAGDIKKLSMRSCFPDLYKMEREHGSLLKGMFRKRKGVISSKTSFVRRMQQFPIFTFKNGMETLISSLHRNLSDNLRLSTTVKAIHIKEKSLVVELENGVLEEANRIFLAVPSSNAASLLRNMETGLEAQECATVAVVNMGWHKKVLKKEGFGYLVPSREKQNVLGVVFDSSAFPQQNEHTDQTRLTVMLGGMHRPEIGQSDHEIIKEMALQAVYSHLGVSKKPDILRVSVARNAIPQYEVGHHTRVFEIEQKLKQASASRIHILGCAWKGVAVNDCVAEARKLAECL